MFSKTYYYSKLYEDLFDSTSWKIIGNEPQPVPAYATQIYFIILTESTRSGGVLMRSADKAYTKEQLMALCHVSKSDKAANQAWMAAYKILLEENVIAEDDNGVISIVLAEEFFGSETESARKVRRYRQRSKGIGGGRSLVSDPRLDGFSDEVESFRASKPQGNQGVTEDGEMDSEAVTEEAHCNQVVTDCGEFSRESVTQKPQGGHNENLPLMNESFLIPSKKQREADRASQCAAIAADFVEIYPKKTTPEKILPFIEKLTEQEAEALLMAARRIASDPSKTEQGGRFAMEPAKFIKSRPWTDYELEMASDVLWGRKRSREAEEREEGAE